MNADCEPYRRYIALCEQVMANFDLTERFPVGTVVTPIKARPALGEIVEVGRVMTMPRYEVWRNRGEPNRIVPVRGLVRWAPGPWPLAGQETWHDLAAIRAVTPKDTETIARAVDKATVALTTTLM